MRYLSIDTDPNTTRVSRIGLGAWQFGSREWGYGQSYAGQEARAIVRRAIELGVTLFDTAEIYGFGRSERILGEAIGEDRESVFLATKSSRCCRSPRWSSSARWPAPTGSAPANSTCTRCTSPIRWSRTGRSCAACARCSGLAWCGRSASAITPGTLARRRAGAGRPGAEQPGPLQPRRPLPGARPAAVRRIDRPRRDRLQPARPGAAVRQVPPGQPANRVRAASPLFLPENLDRAADLIAALREVADAHSATPAQIALAWVIHQPAVVAIPGDQAWSSSKAMSPPPSIDLTEDEYQALRAAATRFQPITGPAVLPRMFRARFR